MRAGETFLSFSQSRALIFSEIKRAFVHFWLSGEQLDLLLTTAAVTGILLLLSIEERDTEQI